MERLERRKTLINTATMPSSSATATVTTNVFEAGKYTTVLQKIESRTTCCPANTSPPPPVPPPKPILIVMPCEAGEFPLLVFLHGYLLYNSFYSQLLQHIASHGFIVIAPQVHITLSSSFLLCDHYIRRREILMQIWSIVVANIFKRSKFSIAVGCN
ncbi:CHLOROPHYLLASE-2 CHLOROPLASTIC [Salix koriyanagi]|uniref:CHLOROPHYLLASE-2 CHLOROPLASTIC n=1 Tax=Salix koriyanagi TaxID=2511006 RepID=A0A9Q0WTY4_9ROSI|nr:CHLOROPHYLLASE-2 CHLOROPLASTIC [Salix koriyanagi]